MFFTGFLALAACSNSISEPNTVDQYLENVYELSEAKCECIAVPPEEGVIVLSEQRCTFGNSSNAATLIFLTEKAADDPETQWGIVYSMDRNSMTHTTVFTVACTKNHCFEYKF